MISPKYETDPRLDLVLERIVDLPVEAIWLAWTTPDYLKQWFTPDPWKTVECEIDLKPGGMFYTVLQSPDGKNHPNLGCFLEVVKNERLVWTDALLPGFRPAKKPFFTATLHLEVGRVGTRYTAIASHANEEDRKRHESLGFTSGWGSALDQLIALMKKAQDASW